MQGVSAGFARIAYRIAHARDLPARPVRWADGPGCARTPTVVVPLLQHASSVAHLSDTGLIVLEGGGLTRPHNADHTIQIADLTTSSWCTPP